MSEDSIDIALAEAYEGGLSAAKARIAELEAQRKYTEQHAADLETEILALREIAHLIGAIFVYGGFKAETYNERELKKLLCETGNFWKSVADYEATITGSKT